MRPVLPAGLLAWLLVMSVIDMSDPANAYGGEAWFGLGPPLVIGLVLFGLGLVFTVASRISGSRYWSERPGVVPEGVLGKQPPRQEDPS